MWCSIPAKLKPVVAGISRCFHRGAQDRDTDLTVPSAGRCRTPPGGGLLLGIWKLPSAKESGLTWGMYSSRGVLYVPFEPLVTFSVHVRSDFWVTVIVILMVDPVSSSCGLCGPIPDYEDCSQKDSSQPRSYCYAKGTWRRKDQRVGEGPTSHPKLKPICFEIMGSLFLGKD